MTPDDLKRIANEPGFGSGARARDRLAAEAECKALLPDPHWMQAVEARGDGGNHMLPVCHFGNSNEDGKDWSLFQDGSDFCEAVFGQDARDDAQIIAAIVNAYRMGILVRANQ